MKKRFSSRELFEVRNYIPVDMLIKDELLIPSKIRDGVFRFLCPICNEFQTATKPTTNLARCFRCEKNFNTIDLVMRVRGSGFRESVLFLQHLLGKIPNKNEDARQALNKLVSGIGRPMPEGLN
jgi:DNA primase